MIEFQFFADNAEVASFGREKVRMQRDLAVLERKLKKSSCDEQSVLQKQVERQREFVLKDINRLTEAFYLYAVKIINRSASFYVEAYGLDREDIFSDGLLALHNTARDYNPDKGDSFQSFFTIKFRGAMSMLRKLRNGKEKRIPSSKIVSFYAPSRRRRRCEGETIEDEVRNMPHDTGIDYEPFVSLLPDALAQLTERERKVLEMRFGLENYDEHTLEETGAKIGKNRETVRLEQEMALTKMRRYFGREY